MKTSGFSLLELLIILVLLGLFTVSGITFYAGAHKNQLLRASVNQIVDIIETAHVFSQTARNESSWGMQAIDQTTYALISKDESGTIQYEKYKKLTMPVRFSLPVSVIFATGTGYLSSDQTIVILLDEKPRATIHINTFGVIESNVH